MKRFQFSLFWLLSISVVLNCIMAIAVLLFARPERPLYAPSGFFFNDRSGIKSSIFLFTNQKTGTTTGAVVLFGPELPVVFVSDNEPKVTINGQKIDIPQNGKLHILGSNLKLRESHMSVSAVTKAGTDVTGWLRQLPNESIEDARWR